MENNVIHDNNVNSVNNNDSVNNVIMTDTLNLILNNQASQMNNLTASLRNTLNEFSAQIESHMRNLTKDFVLHNNKSEDPNGNRLTDSDAGMGSENLTGNRDPEIIERDLDPPENPKGNRGQQEKNKSVRLKLSPILPRRGKTSLMSLPQMMRMSRLVFMGGMI